MLSHEDKPPYSSGLIGKPVLISLRILGGYDEKK
jgi:hypothetical protein